MTTAEQLLPPHVVAEPVILRPAREEEMVLVRAKWLQAYADSPFAGLFSIRPTASKAEANHFKEQWGPVISALLKRSTVTILAPEDSPDAVFYGWIVREGEIVHFARVRARFRRLGYGRKLLGGDMAVTITHPTNDARRIARHWAEENACATGECPDCGHQLSTRTARATESKQVIEYQCRRPARPGHPSCRYTFTRAIPHTPKERPRIVFDPTLV